MIITDLQGKYPYENNTLSINRRSRAVSFAADRCSAADSLCAGRLRNGLGRSERGAESRRRSEADERRHGFRVGHHADDSEVRNGHVGSQRLYC